MRASPPQPCGIPSSREGIVGQETDDRARGSNYKSRRGAKPVPVAAGVRRSFVRQPIRTGVVLPVHCAGWRSSALRPQRRNEQPLKVRSVLSPSFFQNYRLNDAADQPDSTLELELCVAGVSSACWQRLGNVSSLVRIPPGNGRFSQ